MILGYIRVSTDKQTVQNQRHAINEYAVNHKMVIDKFIDIEVSSRKSKKERRIEEITEQLHEGDTLICSELSRLGRSTVEVLGIIDHLTAQGITVILIKQGLQLSKDSKDVTSKVMVTLFSLFSELERDLISQRTREALKSRKDGGMILGRKVGSLSKSQYDKDRDQIMELINMGLSANKICSIHLKYGTPKTLLEWKNKRLEYNHMLHEYICNSAYSEFLKAKH